MEIFFNPTIRTLRDLIQEKVLHLQVVCIMNMKLSWLFYIMWYITIKNIKTFFVFFRNEIITREVLVNLLTLCELRYLFWKSTWTILGLKWRYFLSRQSTRKGLNCVNTFREEGGIWTWTNLLYEIHWDAFCETYFLKWEGFWKILSWTFGVAI